MDEPTPPERPAQLPKYICEPLERQSPDTLEAVIAYADALAEFKRDREVFEQRQRAREEGLTDDQREALEEADVDVDPDNYGDVPSGAYITIKEPKPGYRYYYFQWREGDSWKNEYIAPVSPKE
jgi:hypothetical protein